jgi:hypothetical protein
MASINKSWHCQVVVALVGRVRRAQCLGVHSVRAGQSRSQTRMRTMMTILVVLISPLSEGDCPQFKFPITGTSNRSCSVGEEAHAFDGALLAGAHRPMQARRCVLCHRGASCGTAGPCAFVPSAATRHVDVDVARSGRCCGASLHSSPSFSS